MDINYFLEKHGNSAKNNELLTLIENVDVVSFDIFDTLVVRNVLEPIDIFYLMEKDIYNILGNNLMFRNIRKICEKLARKKALEKNKKEITLDEIYEIIIDFTNISREVAEKIKKIEIKIEKKNIFVREYVKDIYDLAISLNKKIIIVSDMYHSKDVLADILQSKGILQWDELFVSSYYSEQKHSGLLYKHVLEYLNTTPDKILHMGDNYHADITQANKHSIKTFFIPKVLDVFLQLPFAKKFNFDLLNVYEKMMLAQIINKQFDNPFLENNKSFLQGKVYNVGYNIFGPFMFAVILELIKYAKHTNSAHILFIERDGYIPKILFDKMKAYFGLKGVISEDFFNNRVITNMMGLFADTLDNNNYVSTLLLRDSNLLYTLKVVLETLFINNPETLKKIKTALAEKNITGDETIDNTDYIFLIKTVRKYSKDFTILIKEIHNYWMKKFTPLKNVNAIIFDVGYIGTTDFLISTIVKSAKNLNRFFIYTGKKDILCSTELSSADKFFSYFSQYSNPRSLVSLVELIISNPHSTKEVARKHKLENFYNFVFEEKGDYSEVVQAQNGLLDFVDLFIKNNLDNLNNIKISHYFITILMGYFANIDDMQDDFSDDLCCYDFSKKNKSYFNKVENISKDNISNENHYKLKNFCDQKIMIYERKKYRGKIKRFFHLPYYKKKLAKYILKIFYSRRGI